MKPSCASTLFGGEPCSATPVYALTILLRVHRGHQPAQLKVGTGLCAEHAAIATPETFGERAFSFVVEGLTKAGFAAPRRDLTEIQLDRIEKECRP